MKKIIIAGAGGTPSEGVIRSLLRSDIEIEVIGIGSEQSDLIMSSAKRKYLVPYADESNYALELLKVLKKEKPDLIHFQNDSEIFYASKIRDEIFETGTKLFMPKHSVVNTCVNKYQTYLKWKQEGIRVPKNILISNEDDLKTSFEQLSNSQGTLWLRSSSLCGGGKGALPTNSFELSKQWINHYQGWGDFIAAELLTPETVTWMSIWYEGDLVVAQTRKRNGWVHANRTLSGVTGVTKVGETYSDVKVDDISINSIKAIDNRPHGLYGVDLAYDFDGLPNPTEINISRFFTTILFFTSAGLNMPEIFINLALFGKLPILDRTINPLDDGLMWLRGMDYQPQLITKERLDEEIKKL